MRYYFNQPAKWFCMVLALLFTFGLKAQEADNQFSLDAQLVTRGELRAGGFKADSLPAFGDRVAPTSAFMKAGPTCKRKTACS